MKKQILIVCTGNTCRSSMAEGYLKELLKKEFGSEHDFVIRSAGLAAVPNSRASQHAVEVMREDNVDLSSHGARQLTPDMVAQADIVLTMTNNHKMMIVDLIPSAKDKVFLLKQFIGNVEGTRRIQQEVDRLVRTITEKQERFWEEKGDSIAALQRRREQLLLELRQVDQQLKDWEEKLTLAVREEHGQLQELERELSELEIMDPFGQSKDVYRRCAMEIKHCLRGVVDWLQSDGGEEGN